MLERYRRKLVLSSLFGCLACLTLMASVATADGRVFLLDLRNSSDGRGLREAELACGEQQARLASTQELQHAVEHCSFSTCTHGWLDGGTVGTTVCSKVGGALKAVDVRTDNVTVDDTHLDAFCIKDGDVLCGDPPSFPNTRLQVHSAVFQMGDELLYGCVPGYLMPGGHTAFSLLCDSCGEWYGLVQLCIKDETETPVDYEDKFTDTYSEEEEGEEGEEGPEEAQGEVYEEVHGGAARPEEQPVPSAQEQQQEEETVFHVAEGGQEEHDQEEESVAEEEANGDAEGEQEVAGTTEQPVSLLSQKHLFWFPSPPFQEEGHAATPTRPPPVATTAPSTAPEGENRVRASGGQSEESREYDHQRPGELDDRVGRERDSEQEDRGGDDSRPDDLLDDRNDSHYDDDRDGVFGDGRDDVASRHEDDDRVKHYVPSRGEEPPRRRYEDSVESRHDDHYDMGEHEDERRQDRDGDRDGGHGHDSYEDRDDDGAEDQSELEEHPGHEDRDGGEEHYDEDERHDDLHGHNHDHDADDRDDRDDRRHHVVLPMATAEPQNVTPGGDAGQTAAATTDDTWLDGYPVITDEAEKGGSTEEDQEEGGVVAVAAGGTTTDRPNEVEVSRPAPYATGSPPEDVPEPITEQGQAEQDLPGTSEPPSYPDTGDYDAYPTAAYPTPSWEDDPTDRPLIPDRHGVLPAAPTEYYDPDAVTGLWDRGSGGAAAGEHNLTGLAGERGEVEGERGEAPPPPPPPSGASGRGPTVAAVVVAVCAVCAAAAAGAWCYRRRQQKSSVYEMNNGKQQQQQQGQGHGGRQHGQQIEMQQKV